MSDVQMGVFLVVPAYPGCPGPKALNGCVCVCVVPITDRTTTSALYVTACSGPNPEVSFQKNSCD